MKRASETPKFSPLNEEEIHEAVRKLVTSNREVDADYLNQFRESAYRYDKGQYPPKTDSHTSTAVSTDVADVIDWVLPTVLRSFCDSPDVVRFDPVNESDQKQADQESDYVHHVFLKECEGFTKLYLHVREALLLKNSTFLVYPDTRKKVYLEEQHDLTEEEVAILLSPSDGSTVEVVEVLSKEQAPLIDTESGEPLYTPEGEPALEWRYGLRIRRKYENLRAKIVNCRPEKCFPDEYQTETDLTETRSFVYQDQSTRDDLVAAGYDPEKVYNLNVWSAQKGQEVERARDTKEGYRISQGESETGLSGQDIVCFYRVYATLDTDGDGIAEQWMFILGGYGGEELLDMYPVPEVPFVSGTPFLSAHNFYGVSLFEKIRKLADHKSKLLRMLEDNLDLINNPRKKANIGEAVMDSITTRQVGAVWHVDTQESVNEVPVQPFAANAHQLLDYYDKMRAERSGTDPNAMSVSRMMPDEAMNTAMERVLTMKEELVGLVIRVFAETSVKHLLLRLRGILMRHMDKDKVVRLRQEWVTVNPSNWRERTDTTIVVGLSTGERNRKTNALAGILDRQIAALDGGLSGVLVSPDRIRHTAGELVRVSGLGDPDDFWLDPSLVEDPRNLETPKGREVVRALRLQEEKQQQALAMEREKAQAQAQAQNTLVEAQKQIEEIRAEAKIMAEQIRALTADKDRKAEEERQDQGAAVDVEKLRLDWAKLRAEETGREDDLVLRIAEQELEQEGTEDTEGGREE